MHAHRAHAGGGIGRGGVEAALPVEKRRVMMSQSIGGDSSSEGVVAGQPSLQPGSILLVDDDPAIRQVGEDLLRDEGYEVVAASSGAVALAATPLLPPALILLDNTLPNENTPEVATALLARTGWERAKLVLFAAIAPDEAAAIAGQLGASDYLTKPYEADDMLALVSRYVAAPAPPSPTGQ